jgi:hypothetical protein
MKGRELMAMGKTFAASAALGVALLASITAAAADPNGPSAELVSIDCGGGGSTQAAVNGDGEWTPAHDLESTGVFIPLEFGTFTGTLTDIEGNVVDQFVDPTVVPKGNARPPANRDPVDCTYSLTGTFVATQDDAPFLVPGETYTFSGTGDVTGFLTGKP